MAAARQPAAGLPSRGFDQHARLTTSTSNRLMPVLYGKYLQSKAQLRKAKHNNNPSPTCPW